VGVLDLLSGRTRGLLSRSLNLPFNPYTDAPGFQSVVADDLFPEEFKANMPISRDLAISIPAVSKARNLLVATIASKPLVALGNTWRVPDATELTTLSPSLIDSRGMTQAIKDQPTWLYRTNGPVSPYERMAWTIDDCVFNGVSLWLLERGAATEGEARRPITNAEWCPPQHWSIGEVDGHLAVLYGTDGEHTPIPEDRYMLINSPFEGLLNVGRRTLRGAVGIEESWVGRAKNPIPMIDLHRETDDMTDDEVDDMVAKWATARTNPNGAIGSTPPSVSPQVYGELEPALYTEGRNSIRTDVGSFLNIRAAMLDGTTGIDSLTYTTKDGERNLFYELDLPFWTDPIVARLSLDDIVPRGTRIRFDMYEAYNLPAPTGTPTED
jgi:hypothetical protein